MTAYHTPQDDEREESFPEVVLQGDLDTAWRIWRLWRATGRRFLPSQLLNEPQALLDDMLTIEGVSQSVKEELDAIRHG